MLRPALITAWACTLVAAPVSAGTSWQAFETRCLTPMVEVRDTVTDGLTRIPHRAAWESWVPEDGDWELRRALPGAVVQYCAILGPLGPEVDNWAEAAIASGDYTRIDRVPETLQSTFLREPRIEVEIDREAPSLTVIETNLES